MTLRLSARTIGRSLLSTDPGCRETRHRLIDAHAAHYADAGAPVFVDVETVDFNIRRYRFCQRLKRRMKAKRRRDQVDQRRFVADLLFAKQFRTRYVSTPSVSFNSSPVIGALQNVLAIF